MFIENHLSIQRTARYYTYGNLSEQTTTIWFVCHGYGQLAGSFIKKFNVLDSNRHYVVAPEGLSRFYWNGFGGKPVASWMTSEDRLNEIQDYVHYLNKLYAEISKKTINKNIKINVLGFSQGVATVSRWVADKKIPVSKLILWAGSIAHDLNWTQAQSIFQNLDLFIVYGKEDPFIKEKHIIQMKKLLDNYHLEPRVISFNGKHSLNYEALLKIVNYA